jgi:transcriptional regulator with XRE-family HTH domain
VNESELIEYEARQTVARGIQAALTRVPGNSRLQKCSRLGVTPYALDKWITGVSTPSEQNLARLARLANVEQEWIRNGGQDVTEEG